MGAFGFIVDGIHGAAFAVRSFDFPFNHFPDVCNPFPVADIRGWGRLSTEYGEKEAVKIHIANGCIIAAAPEMWELLLDLYNDMDVEIPSKYLDRLTDIRTKIEEGGV